MMLIPRFSIFSHKLNNQIENLADSFFYRVPLKKSKNHYFNHVFFYPVANFNTNKLLEYLEYLCYYQFYN